ncbi:MAG: c-type cytochrome [Lysobacteraceae bacterium]|nr:MAG: c-type cytochrome [Xanthomonadaceae bacterium]
MRPMSRLSRSIVVAVLLCVAWVAQAAAPQVQTLWQLLDYIAVDYSAAVEDGRVANEMEFQEMQEFSATVREQLAELPGHPARAGLVAQARSLEAAIAAKSPAAEVDRQARALADALLQAYPVPRGPEQAPSLASAAALYQQHCASCHGATGAGDGPAAVGMEPPPIAFTDAARARQRSVFALHQVITQGLEGTAMASYAHLPDDQRWALAFYIGQLAFANAEHGESLWESRADLRAQLTGLDALVQALPAGLAGLSQADADDLTAYLRRHPDVVVSAGGTSTNQDGIALARARLQEGVDALAAGDRQQARAKMLSAYLDGFEPVEAVLATRDPALLREIESAMAGLRARVGSQASLEEVRSQVGVLSGLLDRASVALDDTAEAGAGAAFAGALTILLREGLEALLLVIAMMAFLRKAERTDAMPYVHAGWVGALVAGGATWLVATELVAISGASRELTEGFAALVAAVVLVSVGIWMHGKSQADAWQRYVREQLSHALSRGSLWFLFGLSFLIVYREAFETVLFYAALWSQGNHAAVLAGAATAVLALAVIAWLMLRFTRRLPFGKFFAASALLMAVLAVVLAGKGVAALQEAGWLPVSLVPLPRIDLLGMYPTLQGVGAQLLVLGVLLAGFAWNARSARVAAA